MAGVWWKGRYGKERESIGCKLRKMCRGPNKGEGVKDSREGKIRGINCFLCTCT